MIAQFALFPESAATSAEKVDALFFFLCAVTAGFTLLIASIILVFAVRYRRTSAAGSTPARVPTNTRLEIVWTAIPLAIVLVIFVWGARVYHFLHAAPDEAVEVHVIAKQWMWKMQHSNGRREIGELHVPRGRPVKVTLASQDVIHSFFVPAFRVKQDAVPGRYTVAWFEATRTGRFDLFCAEYCGTDHSRMLGEVVVLEPEAYAEWLAGEPPGATPAEVGEKLFVELGCRTCHAEKGPSMAGLWGREVTLSDGTTTTADTRYLRSAILDATSQVVAGYAPIMPSYRGQIDEQQLFDLISYIRSLSDPTRATSGGAGR